MDLVTWIVVGAVVVVSAIGVAVWNRTHRGSSRVDSMDAASADEVRAAQQQVDGSHGQVGRRLF
jgi:hypothetical protein